MYGNRHSVSQTNISDVTSGKWHEFSEPKSKTFQALEVEMGIVSSVGVRSQSVSSVNREPKGSTLKSPNWFLVRPRSMDVLDEQTHTHDFVLPRHKAYSVMDVNSMGIGPRILLSDELSALSHPINDRLGLATQHSTSDGVGLATQHSTSDGVGLATQHNTSDGVGLATQHSTSDEVGLATQHSTSDEVGLATQYHTKSATLEIEDNRPKDPDTNHSGYHGNIQLTAHCRSMDDLVIQRDALLTEGGPVCAHSKMMTFADVHTASDSTKDISRQSSTSNSVRSDHSSNLSLANEEVYGGLEGDHGSDDSNDCLQQIKSLRLLEEVATGPHNEPIKITVSFTIIEDESRRVLRTAPFQTAAEYTPPENVEEEGGCLSFMNEDRADLSEVVKEISGGPTPSKVQTIKDFFLRKVASEESHLPHLGRPRRKSDVVASHWPELVEHENHMLSASLPLLDLACSETDLITYSEPTLPQVEPVQKCSSARVYTGEEVFGEKSSHSHQDNDWYTDIVTETLITQLDHHDNEQCDLSFSDSSSDDDVFVSGVLVSGVEAASSLPSCWSSPKPLHSNTKKGPPHNIHSGPIYLPSRDFPSLDLPPYPRYRMINHRMSIIHEVDEDSDSVLNKTI